MLRQDGSKLYRRDDKELLLIEPWGKNSLRIRATQRHEFIPDDNSALIAPEETDAQITIDGKSATITNGKITCEVTASGLLRFTNQDGKILLEEYQRIRDMFGGTVKFASALEIQSRTFQPKAGMDNYKLIARFEPNEGEKIYGMGQYQQDVLDVKG